MNFVAKDIPTTPVAGSTLGHISVSALVRCKLFCTFNDTVGTKGQLQVCKTAYLACIRILCTLSSLLHSALRAHCSIGSHWTQVAAPVDVAATIMPCS
jgi:hypothetical protein